MKKRFLQFSFIAVLALFITMVSLQGISLTASADGEIDGELTSKNYNNRASVTNFDLLIGSTSLEAGHTLNPNTDVTAQVEITDPDSIDDLNEVTFYFHYDVGGASTPGALSLDVDSVPETDETGEQFVVRWTRATQELRVISNGAATITWDLINSTVPGIGTDYDVTNFTFEFEFTISKVAEFSESSEWYLGTSINDGRVSLESNSDPENVVDKGLVLTTGSSITDPPSGFNMAFYGEIQLSQSNISWTGVRAGDTFSNTTSASTIANMTFISNNDYDTKVKSSLLWEAVITQEIVNELVSGSLVDGDSGALSAFQSAYNTEHNASETIDSISDLVGITFGDANQAIGALTGDAATTWAGIQFQLPAPSNNANLTGASIVTKSATIDTTGFTEQFFMIGYNDSDEISNNITVTDPFGGVYALVGTDFRQFLPNSVSAAEQTATDEDGVEKDLTLYLYLSRVFQNAQYSGTISLQITNNP